MTGVPGAAAALPGDLSSISSTRALADLINAAGVFDAIIHNAGIGYREPTRRETEDGLEHVFQTNVLAPYLLTALVNRPPRLIYLSSGLHRSGDPDLADLQWEHRRWDGYQAYSDSKLFDAVLAAAVARRWPDVISSSVDPGWVRTKMGERGLPARSAPEPRRRSGSRPVTTRSPCRAAATSTTEDCAKRTQPSPTPSSRTVSSPPVMSSPAKRSPTQRMLVRAVDPGARVVANGAV